MMRPGRWGFRARPAVAAACLVLTAFPVLTLGAEPADTSKSVSGRIVAAAPSGPVVTEDTVVVRTLARSRKLQSLTTDVEIAGHRLSSAGKPENPEIRISNVTRRSYDDDFDEMRAALRVSLPNLGALTEDREKARTDLLEIEMEKIRYEQELIGRVRRDFTDVIAADKLAELAEKQVSLLDRRIGMIENLLQTGDRSVVYYMKAKSMRTEARNDLARAVQKQAAARRHLALRTGLSQDVAVQESPVPPGAPAGPDEAVAIASQNRPEAALVRQQISLARKQRDTERFRLLPQLNYIQFSYHREKTRPKDWGEVSAGFDVPLFNWNIGNIKAVNLAVRKREARVDGVLESIAEEVQAAYEQYCDLRLDWDNFSAASETHIRESEDIIAKAPGYETVRSDEVLELELDVIDTRRTLAGKRRDLDYALSELLFAMGVDSLPQSP
jgi:outer membrane protein TolC